MQEHVSHKPMAAMRNLNAKQSRTPLKTIRKEKTNCKNIDIHTMTGYKTYC